MNENNMLELPQELLNQPIEFEYENIDYVVSIEAYKIGWILLPDGRTIAPTSWVECFFPPYPVGFYKVDSKSNAVPAQVNPNPKFK